MVKASDLIGGSGGGGNTGISGALAQDGWIKGSYIKENAVGSAGKAWVTSGVGFAVPFYIPKTTTIDAISFLGQNAGSGQTLGLYTLVEDGFTLGSAIVEQTGVSISASVVNVSFAATPVTEGWHWIAMGGGTGRTVAWGLGSGYTTPLQRAMPDTVGAPSIASTYDVYSTYHAACMRIGATGNNAPSAGASLFEFAEGDRRPIFGVRRAV